jgi:rare lipoprotein A
MRGLRSEHRAPGDTVPWRAAAGLLLVILAWACGSTHPVTTGTTSRHVEEGLASWYGEPFDGRMTSSGEEFRMKGLSAAHRTLPFGTRVRVTNTTNHKAVELAINDRGPFVADRILDLSWGAAKTLDMLEAGVAPIRLEVIALGDGMLDATCWEVQVGAFASADNSERARHALERRGYTARLAPVGGGLKRVRITGLANRKEALATAAVVRDTYPGAVAVPCSGW